MYKDAFVKVPKNNEVQKKQLHSLFRHNRLNNIQDTDYDMHGTMLKHKRLKQRLNYFGNNLFHPNSR